MGGYVTSTRYRADTNRKWWPYKFTDNLQSSANFSGAVPDRVLFNMSISMPQQVTTSYRTSSGEGNVDGDARDLPDTLGAAFQRFRSEARSRATPYDNGHSFVSTDQSVRISHEAVTVESADGRYGYQGPIYPDPGTLSSQFRSPPTTNFGWYGTKAIAETAPTNPIASVAQMLAEIKREGLPTLIGLRTNSESIKLMKPSKEEISSDFLNQQFGWKPLVSDLTKTLSAVIDAKKHLRQLIRDSGRNVRRSYYFDEERWSDAPVVLPLQTPKHGTYSGSNNLPTTALFPTTSSWRTGTLTDTVEYYRQVWFKGAFSYALPGVSTQLDRIERLESEFNHLLGTRLTPDLLWNLAPWTWLADWNWNIGDLLTNVTLLNSDGLVIRYGYMMAHTKVFHIRTLSGCRKPSGGFHPSHSISFFSQRKERQRVNPYGFGSNPGSYTNRQWAILGALGMTRSPGQLRTD